MITRLSKLRYARIAGLALGAVVVAGAAVVITASAAGVTLVAKPSAASPTPSPQKGAASTAVCSTFMHHFAVEIGKSQAQINSAFQNAINDTLKDEVASGQITQAQADTIKQKLTNQTPCTIGASLAPRGGHKANINAYMQAYLSAAAAALHISDAQLKTDLGNGQSLSQIAAAQKVSEADFRSALIANLTPTLDKAVTDKKLTAAQEQAILDHLKTGELPLWNHAPAKPKAAPAS